MAGPVARRDGSSIGSRPTSTSSRPCWKPAGSRCRAGFTLDGKSLMPLLRGEPGRGVARSDALLPVASRRRARAGPRLRRPLAALQAPPARAPARESRSRPSWSSTTSETTRARSTTSPPTTPVSSSGCTPTTSPGSATCPRPAGSTPSGSRSAAREDPDRADATGLARARARAGNPMTWATGRCDVVARRTLRRSTSGSRHDGSRRWSICRFGGVEQSQKLEPGAAECSFPDVPLTQGPGRLEAWVEGNRNTAGVLEATLRRTGYRP